MGVDGGGEPKAGGGGGCLGALVADAEPVQRWTCQMLRPTLDAANAVSNNEPNRPKANFFGFGLG